MRGRVNATSRKCAPILYTFLLFPSLFSAMLPFSFPISRPLVNAGVSALGQRKKGGSRGEGKGEKKEEKKKSEMHSLPYPGENVSGSQQTTGQAPEEGIGQSKKRRGGRDWSIVSEAPELFRIPLLFIITFDRNIAFARRNACTYIPRVMSAPPWNCDSREPWCHDQRLLFREQRDGVPQFVRVNTHTKHYAEHISQCRAVFLNKHTVRKMKCNEIQECVICPSFNFDKTSYMKII